MTTLNYFEKRFYNFKTFHLLISLFLHGSNAQMFVWPQGMPVQQMVARPPTPVPLPIHMQSMQSMQSMYPTGNGAMNNNRVGSASPFSFNGIMSNIKNFFSSHPSNGQKMPQIPPQLLSNPAFRQQLEQVLLTNPALAQSVMQSLGQQNAAMLQSGFGNQVQSRLAIPNQQPMLNHLPQAHMGQANNPQSRVFNRGGSQKRPEDDLFLLTAPFKVTDDTVSSLLNVANQEKDTKQRAMLMKQLLDQARDAGEKAAPTKNNIVVHKVVPAEEAVNTHAQWASAATDSIHSQALPNIMKAIKQLPDNPDRSQILSLLKDQGLLSEASTALSSLQTSAPPTSIQAILKAHDDAKLRATLKRPAATTSSNAATDNKSSLQNPPLQKIPNDLAERLRGLGLNPDFLPDLIRSANLVTNTNPSGRDTHSPLASGSSSVVSSQNATPSSTLKSAKTAKDDGGMQDLRTQLQSLPPDELSKVQNLIQIVVGKPHYLPRLLKEDLAANIRQVLLTVQRLKFPETIATTPTLAPAPVHIPTTTTLAPATTAADTNTIDQIANDVKSSLDISNTIPHTVTVQSQASKVATHATTQSPSESQDNLKEASSLSVLKSEVSTSDKYIPLLYWMSQNGKGSAGSVTSTSPPISFYTQKQSQVQNQIALSSNQQPTVADFNPRNLSQSTTQASVQNKPVEHTTPQPTNFASLAPFIKNIPIEILGSLASNNMPLQKPDVDVIHAGTNSVIHKMKPDELASTQNLHFYGLRTTPKPTIQFETTVPPQKVQQLARQKNDDEPTIPLAALAAALEPKTLSTFLQSMQKKQVPKDGPNLFKIELSQETLPTSVPLSAVFNSVNLNSSNLVSFLNRFSNSPALSKMLTSSSTIAPSTAPPPTYISLLLPSSTASSIPFFPFFQENKSLQPNTPLTSPPFSSSTPKDHNTSDEDKPSQSKKFGLEKKPMKHQSPLSSSEERGSEANGKGSKQFRKENKGSDFPKDTKHFKYRPSAASSEENENHDLPERHLRDREKDREGAQSQTYTKWAAKHPSPSASSEEKNERTIAKGSGHSKYKESHSHKEPDRPVKHRPSSSSAENERDDSRETYSSHQKNNKYAHKATTWHEKYQPSASSFEDRKEYKKKHSQKPTDWPVKSRSSDSLEDEDDEYMDRKNSWIRKKGSKYSKTNKASDQAMKHSPSSKSSYIEDKKKDKRINYHQKENKPPLSSEEQSDAENEHDNARQNKDNESPEPTPPKNKGNTNTYQIEASPSDGQRVEIQTPSLSKEPDRLRDEQDLDNNNNGHMYEKHPQPSYAENEKHGDKLLHSAASGRPPNIDHVSEKDLQTQFADSPPSSQGWEPVIPFHGHLSSKSLIKPNETFALTTNSNLHSPSRDEGPYRNEPERYAWENSQRAVVLPERIQPDMPNQHVQENPASSKENKQHEFEKSKENQRDKPLSERNSNERYTTKSRDQNLEDTHVFKTNTDSSVKRDWAVTPDYILSSQMPQKEVEDTPFRRPTHTNYDRLDASQEDHMETNPSFMQNPFLQQPPPTYANRLRGDDVSAEANTRDEILRSREPPCTHKPNHESGPSLKVKNGDNMAGSQIYQITSPYGKDKLIKVNAPLPKGRSYKPTGKLDKLDGKFLSQSQLLTSTLNFANEEHSPTKYKTPSTFKNSLWGFQGITDTAFNNFESSTKSSMFSSTLGPSDRLSEANGFLSNYPDTTTSQYNDVKLSSESVSNNATNLSQYDNQNKTNITVTSFPSLVPMASESQGSVDKNSQWPSWTTDSVTGKVGSESLNMYYYNSNFTQPMSVFSLPITDNPEDSVTDYPNENESSSLSDSKFGNGNNSDNSPLFRPFYGSNTLWPTFSSHSSGNAGFPQIYVSNSTQSSLPDKVVTNHTDVLINSSVPDISNYDNSQIMNSSSDANDDNAASATDVKHVEMTPPHVDVFTRINNPHKGSLITNNTSSIFVPSVPKIKLRPSGRNIRMKQEVEPVPVGDNDGEHLFSFGNWPKSQNQNERTSEVTTSTTTTTTTSTVGPRKIKLRWSSDKLGHRKVLNSKPVNFYNFYQPNSETE